MDIGHDTGGRDFTLGLATARLARACYARLSGGEAVPDTNRARSVPAAPELAAGRVTSVDALRGFAMFWIVTGDAFGWVLLELVAGNEGVSGAAVRFVGEQFKH